MTHPTAGHVNDHPAPKHVVIIGDGHAGVAAAVRLADHGHRVTIVESSVHIGESSSSHEATDSSQHALMRLCTNQCDLYRRLGVIRDIKWQKTLYLTGEDGIIDEFTGDDLPAPFHLARSLFKMKRFTWAEKRDILRGFLSCMQVSRAARQSLMSESFRDWLLAMNQPEHAVDKFWAAIIAGACNQLPRQISAAYGVRIIQEGFLHSNTAYQMGFSNISRDEFHGRCRDVITKAGGELLEGVRVDRIDYDPAARSVTGVHLTDGQQLTADAYITSLPFRRVAELTVGEMVRDDERLQLLEQISTVPVIGIHFFVDSPDHHDVMTRSHLLFTDGPIRWVFNKGRSRGESADGTAWTLGGVDVSGAHHLHAIVGHAEDYADLSDEQIIDAAFAEMRLCMPSLTEDVSVVEAHVVRETRASSSPRPGGGQVRPQPSGEIKNLIIAGGWASTGWPTTMEGGVRSGYRAAAAVLAMDDEAGQAPDYNALLIPDVQPSNLYKAMSG